MEKVFNLYSKSFFKKNLDKETIKRIKNIIYYLKDNDYSDNFILNYLLNNGPFLINDLWKNSLLKKDKFYYHNILRIIPESSIWNINIKEKSNKFYLEMKIHFTMDNLLDYYYKTLKIPLSFQDRKRDAGAFKYMLSKTYVENIESIDFVLALIDYNKQEKNEFIFTPFDLKYHKEVCEKLNYIYSNSKYKNIIWRNCDESM